MLGMQSYFFYQNRFFLHIAVFHINEYLDGSLFESILTLLSLIPTQMQ
jgi:hypothetical protein